MFTANTKEAAANDIKDAAKNIKEEAKTTAYNSYDDLSDAANRTGRRVRTFIDSAGNEISHATENVTTQIKSNPVQSSFIALAVGFVLGALFRR